jgi:cell wall-associated NlpC family hydrolase
LRARALAGTWMTMVSVALMAGPALADGTGAGGAAAPGPTAAPQQTAQPAPAPQQGDPSGGVEYGNDSQATNTAQTPLVSGYTARILPSGLAAAPTGAPASVQHAIWAANRIIGRPYVYGGGHNARFSSRGYDCSGTVSYALHGASLLGAPLDSSSFMHWGLGGRGTWMTIWTNPGHAFLIIAGLRLDTSTAGDPSGKRGPRWRPVARVTRGFHARHPVGL